MAGDSKAIKLTGSNNFATKLLLEHQDLTTNYLVYAPFARPEDKENSLVDIFYYSEHFYSDKLIQLMDELNIPPECQDEVKLYKKFRAGNNLQKFKSLEIETYTNESIDLGILCVLAGVKTLSFEEMLRKTILAGLTDNSEDSDVRFRSISTMTKIKEKTYIEICLDRFIEIMESEPYLCKVGLLYRFKENDLKNTKVKYIFDLGKVDNHYWVRHAANRFDKANIR